jgi:hypothetical protein
MITERISRFLLGRRPMDKHWDRRLSWSQKVSRLGFRMRDPNGVAMGVCCLRASC